MHNERQDRDRIQAVYAYDLEHPQPRLVGSTPAPNVKECPCTLSYDDRRLIMDRLPVNLLYLSKEFNVDNESH